MGRPFHQLVMLLSTVQLISRGTSQAAIFGWFEDPRLPRLMKQIKPFSAARFAKHGSLGRILHNYRSSRLHNDRYAVNNNQRLNSPRSTSHGV
jgi:hypothetical protein